MRRTLRGLVGLLLTFGIGSPTAIARDEGPAAPVVLRCPLTGTVDAGSADYLQSCVRKAATDRAAAVLVRLDTPGGALDSTRQIVRTFLDANVPIIVWVGPPGARAGSAGVFVTLASHFAAMAPGTNIGAAHPVSITGQAPSDSSGDVMGKKIVNDAAAFAEAIAKERGRNTEWAGRAVRESDSVPADRAVEAHIVNALADSETATLDAADGQTVRLSRGEAKIAVHNAAIIDVAPTLSQGLLHALANPGLAYVLFLVGMLGIAVELGHPGAVAPGVIGVTALILAMMAFSALPISGGAVALLVLGLGLIVAELFVTSGALGAAGAVLLVLGGVLLVDRVKPDWFVDRSFGVPLRTVLPTAVALGGMAAYVMIRAGRARRLPQQGADLGLLAESGTALTEVTEEGGEVFVHGERWHAVSTIPIPSGARVAISRVDGLTLQVREASP